MPTELSPPRRPPRLSRTTWLWGAAAVAVVVVGLAGRVEIAIALGLGLIGGAALQRLTRARADTLARAASSIEVPQGPHLLEAALDGLPDPHLVVEATNPADLSARRIRFANAKAISVLKVSRQGAALAAAVRDPAVLEAIDEALFGGAARVTDYETGGAQTRFWRAYTAPLPADGVSRAVVRLRDETDARRMEAMRVDFLANASHELRTPLSALAGFIETLRGPARDDEIARERFLGIMSVQADRMSRLVADLLSLSRIEMNEHVPPTGEVELGAVIRDVIDATTQIAAQRGTDLTFKDETDGPIRVVGDRDQLVQVVQNLVDNAVKYSPRGDEVILTLASPLTHDKALEPRDSDLSRLPLVTPDRQRQATYALITVRDRGAGMAREHLPRLTERFYRVEGQKSGEKSGTGLGLAIVKHIINRHRGGLSVESRKEAGTVFSVFLPLAEHGFPGNDR